MTVTMVKNHDSLVLRIRDDGEFILFDGAELEELVALFEILVERESGQLTASIDCLRSIKSLSKHSCWALTIPIAQTNRSKDASPSGLSGAL